MLVVMRDMIQVIDFKKSTIPLAQFIHPFTSDFGCAAMFGKQIVAFDYAGGVYYLEVQNLPEN
jgi:hypothetical protein